VYIWWNSKTTTAWADAAHQFIGCPSDFYVFLGVAHPIFRIESSSVKLMAMEPSRYSISDSSLPG
jgi:hypothetical protein